MSKLSRLIVVLGPTASGKSALGLALAERFGGEILVCDSTQVYRHFDIGTAKVPGAEQRGIRHHLVDLVEPHEVFTAGQYRERAIDVLESVRRRNKLSIVTAGTGLYLRALLEGLSDAPTRSEELRTRLRERARRRGPDSLHRLLKRLDPEAAGKVAPRDTQKIIRAIEMRILAGKPIAEIHRSGRSPLQGYDVYKIGLQPPREQLYARIDARVKEMIALGWVDEVRRLIDEGIPAAAKPFQFIGYAELREQIESGQNPEKVIPAIQHATRRFAKRQMTWFRKEPHVRWLTGFGDDPVVVRKAVEIIEGQGDFS